MDFKKILPHLVAFISLLAISCLFFAPNAFSGKTLAQSDNVKARGMQAEIMKYREDTGTAPLWTNSAFAGMPSYQVWAPTPGNLTKPISKAFFLGTGAGSMWAKVFCAMFCMYLLLLAMKLDWRVAIFGALAYGVTTYNVDILEAGHSTKMAALALAPGMLAGALYAFRGRLLLGGGMLAVFTAIQLIVNHVQITYYTFILIGILWLAQLIGAAKKGEIANWGKALGVTILAMSLGFLSNTSKLWPTYEYSKETIRGKSELSKSADKGDGLSKDYAFGWSYGIGESLTLMVPHYAGGGAGEDMTDTDLYKKMYQYFSQQNPGQAKQQAKQQTSGLMYSGSQPFVGTAIYFGAVVLFLAFLGIFLVPGELKIWMLTGGLFMLSVAWGKNFFLNDIWYSIVPMFNKFRAVSMALGVSQLCFAALAAMGLQKLMDGSVSTEKKKRALYIAGGISAALLLLAFGGASATGPNDAAVQGNPQIFNALKASRASLVRADIFRSFAFIAVAFGLVWFYLKGRLKPMVAVLAIAVLALADHWTVAARTLRPEKYEPKTEVAGKPAMQTFDKELLADSDPHFRVLDLTRGGITGNAVTSYYHKSLSGYHAAKLQRYQEVVDTFMQGERAQRTLPKIAGMFNAKYIVTQGGKINPNTEALGNAWFVNSFKTVPDGDTELLALENLNIRNEAVVQEKNAASLQGFSIGKDSTATISLSAYHPDKMEYTYSAKTDQLAMFSEMYYPPSKGWNVTVNGQPVDGGFFKANYTLRGLKLPAADKGTVVMEFHPASYYTGAKISMAASLISILLLLGGLFLHFKNNGFSETSNLDEMPKEEKKVAKKVTKQAKQSSNKRRKR